VIEDALTILWKEWREIVLPRGSLRRGALNLAFPVVVLGVFLPLIAGPGWVGIGSLILYVWMPPYLALGVVADSFAGERERHTLETLLATRMSDTAILLGKVLTAVTYALAMTILVAFLGVAVINVAYARGAFIFFSFGTFAALVISSLLLTTTVANLGVLVSLRAPSVRIAAQRLSLWLVLPGLLATGVYTLLPAAAKDAALAFLAAGGSVPVVAGIVFIVVALDEALFLVCVARFKRDKLVLG